MKALSFIRAALVCAALGFGSTARAQEHETTHHGEETGHAEGGHAAAGHGDGHAAHPEAINWTEFGGTRRDAHGNTKPNPPPFLASVINFSIVLFLIFLGIKRVVNPALATRRAAIEAEFGEAQRLRAEAEAMHRQYTEKLAGLEAEMASLRADVVKAGEDEYGRIIADAKERAERMQKDTEFAIQQEIRQLRTDLLQEAVESAAQSAEKAVRSNIGAQDQTRLADSYVSDLEKNPKAGLSA